MSQNQSVPVGIWLWGDPERIEDHLDMDVVGIVTNTIVLDQLADRFGTMIAAIERYLSLQEREPVVVEVDGDSTDDIVAAAQVFTSMSPRVVLKIPCTSKGLRAVARMKLEGHESMVTTMFSASQAVAAAAAGAAYVAPFTGPTIDSGADASKIIGDIVRVLRNRSSTPYIAAGIVRSVGRRGRGHSGWLRWDRHLARHLRRASEASGHRRMEFHVPRSVGPHGSAGGA